MGTITLHPRLRAMERTARDDAAHLAVEAERRARFVAAIEAMRSLADFLREHEETGQGAELSALLARDADRAQDRYVGRFFRHPGPE